MTPSPIKKWRKPPSRIIKINVDVSIKQHINYDGIGVVIRDDVGRVLSACAKRIIEYFSPHLAERLAAKEGVLLADHALGFQSWIMASNAINVVKAIRSPALQAPEALIIHDIRDVMIHITSGNVSYTSRQENV